MELYKGIKRYLDEKGIKSTHVCERSGITQNALTLTLNGKRKMLADEYVAICRVLGVPLNFFVPETEDHKTA